MNICLLIVVVLFLVLLTVLMKQNDRVSWFEAIKMMSAMVGICSVIVGVIFGMIWFVDTCPLC